MKSVNSQKFIKHFLEYRYIYLFIIFSILIDLVGVYSIEGKFRIEKPLIVLVYLVFFSLIMFNLNKAAGKIIAILLLIFQSFLNVLFKIVYVMQGQTVFALSQLKFIKEGTGVVTNYRVDYILIFNFLLLIGLYVLLLLYKRTKVTKLRRMSYSKILIKVFLSVFLLITMSSIILRVVRDTYFDYYEKPYSTPRKYQTYGVTGNFINELFFYRKVPNVIEEDKVFDFLFSTTKKTKGISEGNNVIIILVETLEWYSFMQDESLYPNGLNNLTDEDLRFLFPNLIKFYEASLKMTNFHSKETTIYSENISILGHHPYKTIPTYDHTYANYEYSLPNMIKKVNPNIVNSYYHNNNITFYGRGSIMNSFGFDNIYGAERLFEEYGDMLSYSEIKLRESITYGITDASMFEVAKEIMFPLDKSFFTYITTLTMHGSYEDYRYSLLKYYEKIDSLNKDIFSNKKIGTVFKNYIASVLNFDEALGIMMDYLDENNLLDKTTIVLFSDHQAYSNDLTYHIREETFYKPIAFNVPFMIYDKNIANKTIDKFTTNIDIVPTIFDIMGIDYYENFYYGNSIFDTQESVLYSYYYDGFLTDKILFNTLSNVIYINEDLNETYIMELKENIKCMFKKVKYIDQWYYYYSHKKHEWYNV